VGFLRIPHRRHPDRTRRVPLIPLASEWRVEGDPAARRLQPRGTGAKCGSLLPPLIQGRPMSDHDRTSGPAAISRTSMEIVTSLVIAGVGIVALWDSRRLGDGWGTTGRRRLLPVLHRPDPGAGEPRQPGAAAPADGPGETFLTRPQLGLVLTILVPAVVYVAAIPFVGIYVASAVLVTWSCGCSAASPGRPRCHGPRDRGRRLHHLRDLVPGGPAQGPPRSLPRLLTKGRKRPWKTSPPCSRASPWPSSPRT
jgi:hypothetical protein